MNFMEAFQTFGSNIWIYGGAFILVLGLLVFIHEWGHYIVARFYGVYVEEFSVGFGKELFGFNDKHGTRWKICLIPLGGYVKMYGTEDPASTVQTDVEAIPKDRMHEAFFAKPVCQRSAIVFAGPAINYLFAIIVMAFLFATNGQPVTAPVVGAVMEGTAAERAGFEPGDEVIRIDREDIQSFEDIRRAMLISLDEARDFTVLRDGEEMTLQAEPDKKEQSDRFGFKSSRGFLGIVSPRHAVDLTRVVRINGQDVQAETILETFRGLYGQRIFIEAEKAGGEELDKLFVKPLAEWNADLNETNVLILSDVETVETFVQYSPLDAVGRAVYESYDITVSTLKALGQMITGSRSANELGGLIRIGAMAGDVAQQGAISLLMFAALLSINLGLINLFPIPVLDGGHLTFYAIEAIAGKPVPEQMQEYAFRFGFVFLILVMAFANINDIVQLFL